MNYDADKLAAAVTTKRQIENRLTMRQAAKQVGCSAKTVHKAETRKPISEETFTKICDWLEMPPGAFFKEV